jgi:hypothetical protein
MEMVVKNINRFKGKFFQAKCKIEKNKKKVIPGGQRSGSAKNNPGRNKKVSQSQGNAKFEPGNTIA